MRAILSGRVECCFSWRQRKDQPAMACIHRLEPENVAEEGAVRFRIFTVNNDVSARDHLHLLHSAFSDKEKHRSEDRPLQTSFVVPILRSRKKTKKIKTTQRRR